MVNLQELELKLRVEKEIENEYKNLPHLMNESLILKEEHLRKVIKIIYLFCQKEPAYYFGPFKYGKCECSGIQFL